MKSKQENKNKFTLKIPINKMFWNGAAEVDKMFSVTLKYINYIRGWQLHIQSDIDIN